MVLVTLLRASRVSGKHSGFLVDGEAAGRRGLGELGGDLRQCLLEGRAVEPRRSEGLPRDFERTCEEGFFRSHHALDFILCGGDLRIKLFARALELHQFLDLGFHVRVRHFRVPPLLLDLLLIPYI